MPTFGGPSPEEQLLDRMAREANAAYDEVSFDQRRPPQPVVSRTCPVCDDRVTVEEHGHDVLGIGMSLSAANELADAYEAHVSAHQLDEVLSVIVALRAKLREMSRRNTQLAVEDVHAQQIQQVLQDPAYSPWASAADTEERLRLSRAAQEAYDPIKETPRYSADLPAGTVGIRR